MAGCDMSEGFPKPDEERLTTTFLDLVRISSPSKHESAIATYARRELEKAGCSVYIDVTTHETGSDTGNLIATLKGTAPGTVYVTAHMDTVEPAGNINPRLIDDIVYSDGTTVLGGDDKVGVAAGIEAARVLASCDWPHPTLKLLFTVQEELGLVGAKSLPDDMFDGELVLVCDEDAKPGTVVAAAPYHYAFAAAFKGIAAHAAVAPEKGISAIAMAADAITKMKLGRLDEYLVSNVGTISGGTADNTVAAACELTGECRALSLEEADEVRGAMTSVMHEAADAAGGSVVVDWNLLYPGFRLDEEDPALVLARHAADKCGLEYATQLTLGATDANIFTLKGAHCLLVGTGMKDFHTTHESLELVDLLDTTRFVVAICCAQAEG